MAARNPSKGVDTLKPAVRAVDLGLVQPRWHLSELGRVFVRVREGKRACHAELRLLEPADRRLRPIVNLRAGAYACSRCETAGLRIHLHGRFGLDPHGASRGHGRRGQPQKATRELSNGFCNSLWRELISGSAKFTVCDLSVLGTVTDAVAM